VEVSGQWFIRRQRSLMVSKKREWKREMLKERQRSIDSNESVERWQST
jgi:hypothetical protein